MTVERWLPDGQSATEGADASSLPHPDAESGEAANAPHLLDQNTLSALLSLVGEGGAELVGELVDLFAEEAPRLISSMREAVGRGDDEELRRSAHSLKGSSGTVGATSLASRAYDVEQRARAGETDGVEETIEEIAALSQRVVTALRTWVKAA